MDDELEDEVPIAESYWVVKHQFLAGESPASPYFEEKTRSNLDALLDADIRCFIDLTDPAESTPYADELFEIAGWYDLDVVYGNYPLDTTDVDAPEQIKSILDVIDGSIAAEQPVYVHCNAGVGRTGVIVGCYLVRHGMSGEQALEQIAELRQHVSNAWQRSPESDAQVELVKSWKTGH